MSNAVKSGRAIEFAQLDLLRGYSTLRLRADINASTLPTAFCSAVARSKAVRRGESSGQSSQNIDLPLRELPKGNELSLLVYRLVS